MKIFICIDDTDSLESRGTGELAEMIADAIEKKWNGKRSEITRHQLLLHEDIPYTSHNSSMCFEAEIEEQYLESVITYASNFLKEESEPEADPGLCVATLDYLENKDELIDFGYKAKKEILIKEKAYGLADKLGIHLSEHGGNGQGVIGALAGVGLRLSGNDGWFKGAHKIKTSDNIIKVRELCKYKNIDKVRNLDGKCLDGDEEIELGKLIKSMLIEGEAVVLVEEIKEGERARVKWRTCSKQRLLKIGENNVNVVYK
ncbi:MAG: hypothetical protein Q8936_12340 [Bacillota bacterium]|nr:hypothetical protein [Bacillota bacterium]